MMPAVISAALITYCGLLSLFPLLLASTVLGLKTPLPGDVSSSPMTRPFQTVAVLVLP